MVRALGTEIRHRLRLGFPGVPHDDVGEHVPGEFEPRFSFLEHGDELGRVGGVDAVRLRRDFDGGFGGGRGGVLEDFVVEGSGFEAGDCGVGNVLGNKGKHL